MENDPTVYNRERLSSLVDTQKTLQVSKSALFMALVNLPASGTGFAPHSHQEGRKLPQ